MSDEPMNLPIDREFIPEMKRQLINMIQERHELNVKLIYADSRIRLLEAKLRILSAQN
jgi:hypothetical protein